MSKQFDVIFLSNNAIGNTLEMLYAIEYCLYNNIKAAIYVAPLLKSFKDYLVDCYGDEVILDSLDGVTTKNLIDTFIVNYRVDIEYDNYIYISPDKHSTKYKSETEQYLDVVKALYPSNYNSYILTYLKAKETPRIKELNIKEKYVIYPGCSSSAAVRRWPRYMELIEDLGEDNVVVVGGNDDLNNEYAYIYPKYLTTIMPIKLTNNVKFWNICKKLNLLKPYAHNNKISKLKYSFFNLFTWEELAYIFKNAKAFIGNDGGLMHFASSVGAKGIAIFGPTSVDKSKSYNPNVKEMLTNYDCQPCFFEVGRVICRDYAISCPYQVKCLQNISVDDVKRTLKEIEVINE